MVIKALNAKHQSLIYMKLYLHGIKLLSIQVTNSKIIDYSLEHINYN